MLRTHRVTHNHGGVHIVVGEVEGHLHAGVAAADDEHLAALVGLAAAVVARVHHLALEAVEAVDLRQDGVGVLARGDDEPFGAVLPGGGAEDGLLLGAVDGGRDDLLGAHAPELAVELGADDLLAEEGADAEGAEVLLEVVEELLPGGVLGVADREGHERQLAVALGQVQAEAAVRAVAPERGDAAVALEQRVRHAAHGEAGGHRQPRGPRADDQRPREHLPVLADGEAGGRGPRGAARAVERVVRPLAFDLGEAVHVVDGSCTGSRPAAAISLAR
jgi:hypothetical protein